MFSTNNPKSFEMLQMWLKMALNHLFEHPMWSRNTFGKIIFNHFCTHM